MGKNYVLKRWLFHTLIRVELSKITQDLKDLINISWPYFLKTKINFCNILWPKRLLGLASCSVIISLYHKWGNNKLQLLAATSQNAAMQQRWQRQRQKQRLWQWHQLRQRCNIIWTVIKLWLSSFYYLELPAPQRSQPHISARHQHDLRGSRGWHVFTFSLSH